MTSTSSQRAGGAQGTVRSEPKPCGAPLDLLCVAAHPDDAELFCGGVLALSAEQGHRVGILDLSLGELSTQGTVEERLLEAEAARRVLGAVWRENLALPDGSIGRQEEGGNEQVSKLVGALRATRPTVVLAPFWRERHPDHIGASELLSRAVFLAALPKFQHSVREPGNHQLVPGAHRVAQVLYFPMRVEARTSFVVDTTSVREKKHAAIACYASQIQRVSDDHPTLVSSPLLAASVDARDGVYGARIGVGLGEGFVVKSALAISDPVAYFRDAGLAHALSFPEEQ